MPVSNLILCAGAPSDTDLLSQPPSPSFGKRKKIVSANKNGKLYRNGVIHKNDCSEGSSLDVVIVKLEGREENNTQYPEGG